MGQPENDPEYWRLQAEDARAAAANLRDPVAKAHMEAAAEAFERIAKLAERAQLVPEQSDGADQP